MHVTTIKAARSLAAACGLALCATIAAVTAAHAGSTEGEVRQREQVLQNGAAAADQRSNQARNTADRQQRLIIEQIRRNRQLQCKAAGGGPRC
jgi:hypothetical protein